MLSIIQYLQICSLIKIMSGVLALKVLVMVSTVMRRQCLIGNIDAQLRSIFFLGFYRRLQLSVNKYYKAMVNCSHHQKTHPKVALKPVDFQMSIHTFFSSSQQIFNKILPYIVCVWSYKCSADQYLQWNLFEICLNGSYIISGEPMLTCFRGFNYSFCKL